MNLDASCTANRFFKFKEFLVSKQYPNVAREMDLNEFERHRIQFWCQCCGDPWRLAQQSHPLVITSAKRVPRLNDLVGGSFDSDHLHCCAVDLCPRGMSAKDFFCSIIDMELPYRQLILYHDFVHWSINVPGRSYKREAIIK